MAAMKHGGCITITCGPYCRGRAGSNLERPTAFVDHLSHLATEGVQAGGGLCNRPDLVSVRRLIRELNRWPSTMNSRKTAGCDAVAG